MIEKILEQSVQKKGHEVSFILGHKILAKTSADWFELKGDSLTVSEWEDLKELCLQSNEKVMLETKGFVSGFFKSENNHWKFSFTEKKDCFKAYLSLTEPIEKFSSEIESPSFWDMIKKDKGLFIIAGEKRQGKSTLLAEIILNDQRNKLTLTGLHSQSNQQQWPSLDSLIHLGSDSIDWDIHHLIYDGIERVIVDFNAIKNWTKWIDLVEQGQSVLVTVSSGSVSSLLQKFSADLNSATLERLIQTLNGIVVQKLVGENKIPVQEIFVLRSQEKEKILKIFSEKKSFYNLKWNEIEGGAYQSLNQSLIQKLIRRKIDVKAAFAASNDPDHLDSQLKKLGL